MIATSFGGHLALRAASVHGDRLRRMVLCGWSVGAPIRPMPLVMRVASAPRLGRLMTAMPMPRRAVRPMLRSVGLRNAIDTGKMTEETIDTFHALLRHTNTMRNEIDAGPRIMTLRGMEESILIPDDVLGAIRTPTLFLWGEDDPFGGPDIARQFATKLPDAHLEVIPHAGHAVWVDEPELIAEQTTTFFRT